MYEHSYTLNTSLYYCLPLFSVNATTTTEIYTLSLHDALPISLTEGIPLCQHFFLLELIEGLAVFDPGLDRKSTRLNSSHVKISYAVFCLKKKKNFTFLIWIVPLNLLPFQY